MTVSVKVAHVGHKHFSMVLLSYWLMLLAVRFPAAARYVSLSLRVLAGSTARPASSLMGHLDFFPPG